MTATMLPTLVQRKRQTPEQWAENIDTKHNAALLASNMKRSRGTRIGKYPTKRLLGLLSAAAISALVCQIRFLNARAPNEAQSMRAPANTAAHHPALRHRTLAAHNIGPNIVPNIVPKPGIEPRSGKENTKMIPAEADLHRPLDASEQKPPFAGTVWANSEVYRPGDPSRYIGVSYEGISDQAMEVFQGDTPNTDWHVETVKDVYCFQLQASTQHRIRVHAAPDFGSRQAAQAEVERYGKIIGQMPSFLTKGLKQIGIHNKGHHTFSANGQRHSMLIYKEANDQMFGEHNYPHLEEATFHELTHAAIEAGHIRSTDYALAVAADPIAISDYAANNPQQEDLSESLLMIYASQYRPERLTNAQKDKILGAIPNRIAYAQRHIIKHPHLRGGDV